MVDVTPIDISSCLHKWARIIISNHQHSELQSAIVLTLNGTFQNLKQRGRGGVSVGFRDYAPFVTGTRVVPHGAKVAKVC